MGALTPEQAVILMSMMVPAGIAGLGLVWTVMVRCKGGA